MVSDSGGCDCELGTARRGDGFGDWKGWEEMCEGRGVEVVEGSGGVLAEGVEVRSFCEIYG